MSVFEQRLSFWMLQNVGGGSWGTVSSTMGSWQSSGRGFKGVNPLDNFVLFTSGGQINNLK